MVARLGVLAIDEVSEFSDAFAASLDKSDYEAAAAAARKIRDEVCL